MLAGVDLNIYAHKKMFPNADGMVVNSSAVVIPRPGLTPQYPPYLPSRSRCPTTRRNLWLKSHSVPQGSEGTTERPRPTVIEA